MPGTIRLSVLEFIDLPDLLPSPISIKVSMGKRHYETSDEGNFSFPLTTLRDDVILIVQDAGGNEISRAGVQAKSIVEKGYWDDLFPLQGGGRVHLQFQFALSEDDRSRIRMMRETAMRRKHVERQDRNLKTSGSNMGDNPELSDSQKCLLQIGDLSAKEAAQQSPSTSTEKIPDEKPVTERTNNVQLDQAQPLSNDADRSEDNPSTISQLQEVDANKPLVNNTVLVERLEIQSPHANKPSPTIRSEENLFSSQGSELPNSSSKVEAKTDAMETPSRRRAPGNVKKVISAFESSLTQDTKPRIKPALRNAQNSVVEKQTSVNVNQSKKPTEDNTKPILSQTPIGPSLAGELTHDLADIKQKEHKHKFIEASDGTKLSEDPGQSLKLKGKKNQVGGETLSEKDKTHKERDDIADATNDESYQKLVPEKPDGDRNSVTGESVSCVEDEQFPSKRSGGWIFPDERRRLCVTTGGNQMQDLAGEGRKSYTFIRKGEMKISTEESRGTSETKVNGGKREHQEMIKPDSSDDVKPFEGALANALKIAIMVGFGTLVLLTRQRKKKK